jgi:hypothetical protein
LEGEDMRTRSFVIFGTVIFVLALAAIALAADPFEGTWKTNASKSKLAAVADWVKEMTVTFRVVGDQFTYESKGTYMNGSSFSNKGSRPSVGGIAKNRPPDAEGTFTCYILIAPGDAYGVTLQDGKQTVLTHWVASKDGKTITITVKGMDAKGKPVEALLVLDRQ